MTPSLGKATGGPNLQFTSTSPQPPSPASRKAGSWRPKSSIYLNLLACPRHGCPERQLEAQFFNSLKPPRLPMTPSLGKATGGPNLQFTSTSPQPPSPASRKAGSWRPKSSIYLNLLACPRHGCPERQLEAQFFNSLKPPRLPMTPSLGKATGGPNLQFTSTSPQGQSHHFAPTTTCIARMHTHTDIKSLLTQLLRSTQVH